MADDILSIWKQCILMNSDVIEVNNKISLGGRIYPKDFETTFPVKQAKDKEDAAQKYYTVGEIFFFVKNHGLTQPNYMQKAKENNIGYVRRPDRKAILNQLAIGACRPKLRSHKSVISDNDTDPPAKKAKTVKTITEEEEEKPRIKTYSRKKNMLSSRSYTKRPSVQSQGQSLGASTDSGFHELSSVQAELQNQQRIVRSMTLFLRDFLGMSSSQLELLQSDQYNPADLKKIASVIQSQSSCGVKKTQDSVFNTSHEDNRNSVNYCYKAEKHPSRGWEIVKKNLSEVLNGFDSNHKDIILDEDHRAALETCLNKTAIPLKHALSVLISQMRELNKSPDSFEKADLFCQKVVKDCLVNAEDSFRDAFGVLFKTLKGNSDGELVEKWVSVCEAELKKLLLSLVKSLQTLRDIPPNESKKSPSTLFHFPEPVFSMALNPAKVTHSVVLEMYIKIGLAELRQIITSSVSSSDDSFDSHCCAIDSSPHTTSLILPDIKQEQDVCESFLTDNLGNESKSEGMDRVVSSTSEDLLHTQSLTSPSSMVSPTPTSHHSAPELDKLSSEMNGKPRNDILKNTTCQARRSSESDSCHYSMFKASLGNTMVSAFKKQIQEKIQASSVHYGWN